MPGVCVACKLVVFNRFDNLSIRIPRKGTKKAREWAEILQYSESEYSSFPEHSYICPSHIENQEAITFNGLKVESYEPHVKPKALPYKLFREIVSQNPFVQVSNTKVAHDLDISSNSDPPFSPISYLNQLNLVSPSNSTCSLTTSTDTPRITSKRAANWSFFAKTKKAKYECDETMAIVSLQKLFQIFRHCFDCSNDISQVQKQLKTRGTALSVYYYCSKCKAQKIWHSQDFLPNTACYKGNTKITAAAFLTPINPQAMKELFQLSGIIGFSDRIHKNEMKKYIMPEVEKEYLAEQKRVIDEINQLSGPKVLAGDGQWDSPGFCAQNHNYSFINVTAVCVLAKNKKLENCLSQVLEPMAMNQLLNELLDKGLEVDEVVTDRSKSVTTKMQQNFPNIKHWYDAWHVIKQVKYEFLNYAKTKKNEALKPFIKAFVNHLWYSLYWSRENPEHAREIMLSCLFHCIGKHEWQVGSMYQQLVEFIKSKNDPRFYTFPEDDIGNIFKTLSFKHTNKCLHEEAPYATLDCLSIPFFTVLKTLTKDKFLTDYLKLSHEAAKSKVESLKAISTNIYRPKRFYYNLYGFTIRSKLAFLHFNNAQREISAGKTRLIGSYDTASKANAGEKVSKKRYEKASSKWKQNLIQNVLKQKENSQDVESGEETEESDDEDQAAYASETVDELLEMDFSLEDDF